MPRSRRLRLGEGARCSVLVNKIRPSAVVDEHFPNKVPRQRLDDLIAVRREQTTRRGATCEHVYFRSDTIPGELHVASRWCVVKAQGHPDSFWDEVPVEPRASLAPAPAARVNDIEPSVFGSGNRAEDIALVRNQGLEVDDDNDPAPENIPDLASPRTPNASLYNDQEWGWDGIDRRAAVAPTK